MNRQIILFIICLSFFFCWEAKAYWIWTPETKKWINPKYAVKDTPQEQLEWAMILYMEKNYEQAINEFKKLIKHYPNSSQACDAQYYIGRVYEEMGKYYEAFKAYQKVIDVYPYTQKVEEIIEKQYRIGDLYYTGHKDNFLGINLGSPLERALEIFQKVIDNAPYGQYAAISQYKIGIILGKLGRYGEARQAFIKLEKNYPDSEFAKEAKYQIGLLGYKVSPKSHYTQEETDTAIKEMEEYLNFSPKSSLTEDAQKILRDLRNKKAESLFKIAQFYERQKKFESALVYYEDIVNQYSDTEWAPKSLEKISIIKQKKR